MVKGKFDDSKVGHAKAEVLIRKAFEAGRTKLELTGLNLRDLPKSLADLSNLETLWLFNNELTDIPDWLGGLKRIRDLRIHDNKLKRVPECLLSFERLQTLTLSYNDLEPLPTWFANLRNLRILNLGHTGLRWLPDFISELTELRDLALFDNQLTELPESIGRLIKLKRLSLYTNRLTALPDSIRNLTALEELTLQGNQGLALPSEVLGSIYDIGPQAAKPADILSYYFRLRAGKRPLNEAKLILLGRGEVGKTALVNRLVYDKFLTTSMTKGISITHWSVRIDEETVLLHVWDFGGQEIQHATHQFFLTERSLYLVVLNGRAGAEDEDAEYWLKFVKTFGASSPTIVVLNKIRVQPFQLNRTDLKEKYPFINAFVETDCKPASRNGRLELLRRIESALASMENVRADFPAGWFQIKDRLSKMKKPFISFAEYRKICKELGEGDEQAQERLAGFLDDLGIALNFREDQHLRQETVLNPHWITEGVYRIITSKLLANQQGELKLTNLKVIFKGKKDYPPRMHGFLIELMRKFELCFPFQDDPAEHRYLVPELLGKEQPTLKDDFRSEDCLNFRYDYRLMPEGLLPRFITRTHTMSQPAERWRTGVVLRWEGSRALVKADKQDRQVIVRVFGESEKRRRLLAVIRQNFDQIHSEMKEFKPTQWVALEGHPNEWVSFSELEVFEQKQMKKLTKSVGREVVAVDVSSVLDETDVPGARQKTEELTWQNRPLKLFISYAHEDEKWRSKLAPNLDLLQREGLVEVWCDLQINAGDNWDIEIKQKLEKAELYLFLMSTDLLVSDYVRNTELPIALKRHQENKAKLIPVIVRKCGWTRYVGDIQGLPKAGRPIKQWPDKDQACFDVEEGLRKTISETLKLLERT